MATVREMSVSELAELVRDDALLRAAFVHEYSGPGDAATALEVVVNQASLVSPAEYAELARLAFGRPDPERADAQGQATRELEKLAAERDALAVEVRRALLAVLDRDPVVAQPVERRRVSALLILAIAGLALVAAVAGALLKPVPSLAVFDRQQTTEEAVAARDLRPLLDFNEPVFESLRILGEDDGVFFLAMRVEAMRSIDGTEAGVCLYVVGDGGSGAGCSPIEQVRVAGISGRTGPYNYSWGPTGPLVLTGGQSDAPAGR